MLLNGSYEHVKIVRFATQDAGVNLAKEEFLFDTLTPQELVISLYVNRPAVIIGRNQNPWYECPLAAAGGDVPFYRRLSGGGAVYHDLGNLNFSFMANAAITSDEVTAFIVTFLQELGFAAYSAAKGDILLDGRKLSGRASYYRGNRVLHHGTLLVNADRAMMKRLLAPPEDVVMASGAMASRPSSTINLQECQPDICLRHVIERLVEVVHGRWSGQGVQVVEEDDLSTQQYATRLLRHNRWDWRFGRTPFFKCKSLVSQGDAATEYSVRDGLIEATSSVGSAMRGQRFELPLCYSFEGG